MRKGHEHRYQHGSAGLASFVALASLATVAASLLGCSGGGSSAGLSMRVPPRPTASPSSEPDSGWGYKRSPHHIVVVVQENRTVDNLFNGFPGADTQSWGLNSLGKRVTLRPESLAWAGDVDHTHRAFAREFDNGKLDGWDKVTSTCGANKNCDGATIAFSTVPRTESAPYWQMGRQWSLADHVLQTNEGPSYPAHVYLIAGQTGVPTAIAENTAGNCAAEMPSVSIDLNDGFPGREFPTPTTCRDFSTIFDEVTQQGNSWKYYTPIDHGFWTPTQGIRHLYGSPNLSRPETDVLSDIANGKLPNLAYVIPTRVNSDHAGPGDTGGPAWVATIVNAVGQSRYWNDSLILVVWDDWGGWFDHYVPRHPVIRPDDPYEYGFRVPLLMIGPYVKKGYVSHPDRDFTAILNTIEQCFHTPTLRQMNAYTDDLSDMVDFSKSPRPFQPVTTQGRTPASFLHGTSDVGPPDTE